MYFEKYIDLLTFQETNKSIRIIRTFLMYKNLIRNKNKPMTKTNCLMYCTCVLHYWYNYSGE